MARQAALAAFPFGGFVNETNTSSSGIGGSQLDASSPASGAVISQTAAPASVAATGKTANDNRAASGASAPGSVAVAGQTATSNKSQGAVGAPNTVTITPGAGAEVRSGTQAGAPNSATLTGQTASGTKGSNAVAPTTSQRQAVVIAFPNVAFLNESRTASGAANGAYVDETPASASTMTISQTAIPASIVETGQTATGTKTTQQGNSGSATGQPASVAVTGQSATGTGTTAAPGVVASSRQASVARFPMPMAFINERGAVASGTVAGSYLDETKASPKTVSQTAAPASVTTAPGTATSTSASKQTISQSATPGTIAATEQSATGTVRSNPAITPRSRLGLGIGLTPLVYNAAASNQTAQTATPSAIVATGQSATGTQSSSSGQQPLRVVATGVRINDSAVSTSTGKTQSVARQPVWMGGDASEVRLTFQNWYYAATGVATTPPTALTIVKASLEKGDGSQTIPLTFSGARSITLQPNDNDIQTDLLLANAFTGQTKFAADSQWWVRVSMIVPSTSGFLPTNIATGNTISGAKSVVYAPANDIDQIDSTGALTTPSGASSANYHIGAVAVLGRYLNDAATRSTFFCSDSIGVGVGDTAPFCPLGSGFYARALSSNGTGTPTNVIAAIFASRAGSGIAPGHMTNSLEMAYFKYTKTLFDEIGTNSIPGNPSNATYLSQEQNYWSTFRTAGGQRIVKAYITPKTTSTDSFASASGQTPANGRGAGNVPGIDDWDASMRAQVSNGNIDMYVDSPSLRDGTDPHLWFSNGTASYATADGLHPSQPMHILKGADTRTALLSFS